MTAHRPSQVRARAKLQRDVTMSLASNIMPPVVLKHVLQHAAIGDGSEVAAWKFDAACILQSDIVGFTSLGSRVSPEELCRYAEGGKMGAMETWYDVASSLSEMCMRARVGSSPESAIIQYPPHSLPSFLHDLFTRFDDLVARFKMNKIETVG